jgi:hypothetical protein
MGKVYDALRHAENRRHENLASSPSLLERSLASSALDDSVLLAPDPSQDEELVERIASLEVAICALYDRLDAELPETAATLDSRLDLAVVSIIRLLESERVSIESKIQSSTRRLSWLTGALTVTVLIGLVSMGMAQL